MLRRRRDGRVQFSRLRPRDAARRGRRLRPRRSLHHRRASPSNLAARSYHATACVVVVVILVVLLFDSSIDPGAARGDGNAQHAAAARRARAREGARARVPRGLEHAPLGRPALLHLPHPDARALLPADAARGRRGVPRDRPRLRDAPLAVRRAVPLLRGLAPLHRRRDGRRAAAARALHAGGPVRRAHVGALAHVRELPLRAVLVQPARLLVDARRRGLRALAPLDLAAHARRLGGSVVGPLVRSCTASRSCVASGG